MTFNLMTAVTQTTSYIENVLFVILCNTLGKISFSSANNIINAIIIFQIYIYSIVITVVDHISGMKIF